MGMQEKINEVAIKWADEYDSRDPLQIAKLSDAIIAALREQEPVAWMNQNATYFEKALPSTVYGSHTIPLYALPIPPVEQADEMHKLRQGLRRIAEMIDRDGKAIEMHLQVHLKELFGIARAALSEQQPGEKS